MKIAKTFLFAAVAIGFILGGSTSAYYKVIDLGTLGANQSFAYSINNNGQIVGGAYDISRTKRACLFDSTGGGVTPLAAGPSWAYSNNDLGQIVGQSGPHACLFDPTGGGDNKNLGTLAGYPASEAESINNNGQIVGYVWGRRSGNDTYERACLFDPTGGGANIDLGTLGGKFFSRAYSINNTGQIVGWALDSSEDQRACLFDPTGGGDNIDLGQGSAWSINDSAQIVGARIDSSYRYHPCLFDPTGGGANIDLVPLQDVYGLARCINDLGQIVGRAGGRACLFDPTGNGNNIDLNTLIDPSSEWLLYDAYSINNNGWIVGWGYNSGASHAFLLILEPAIEAEIDVDPDTLNLKSKGKWITCNIWLPEEYNVADVNSYSVFLKFGEVKIGAEWIWVDEEEQIVMAKFNRLYVQDIIEAGEVELTIGGELIDGTRFEGTDTISVIDKRLH